jgi:hypothetical protein
MADEEKKNKRELKTIFMVEFTNFNLPFVLFGAQTVGM